MTSEELMSLPQGDVRLLETDIAQRLLTSKEVARVAYVAKDGTPRVFPTMFRWADGEFVMATFAGAAKIPALRERPELAITIDVGFAPPEVLLLRGPAEITEVDGIAPDYAAVWRRYKSEEEAAAIIASVDKPGVKMARIALRPTWVGVLDFATRLPAPLQGGQ